MQTAQIAAQNNLHTGTFLDSKYLDPGYLFNHIFPFFKDCWNFVSNEQAINAEKTILFFFVMFFLTIICYAFVRLLEIRKKEKKHLLHEISEYAHNKIEYEKRLHEEVGGSKNERWGKTLNYLFSQHGSDWKLAIIEADSMLEELMGTLGFAGDNLGDKLKSASQETFPQLSVAWEIHTIRNRIAHEGLAFELSQHEAKRVIALYEQIFHSYGFI